MENIRINHRPNEFYAVYTCLLNQGVLFKDVKRWFPYKNFRTKQAALKAIARYKEKSIGKIEGRLIYKIVWNPYPFCNDSEKICVYNEDKGVGNNV